jgi:hypothetical protein
MTNETEFELIHECHAALVVEMHLNSTSDKVSALSGHAIQMQSN